jgi:RNA-directed DNA polymerase
MYAGKLHFAVDVDIKGFFDNVDHSKLIKQIWTMGVRDKKLISIVREMLRAPIKMPNGEFEYPTRGTPQGGILSPLLSNIVLNELDWWVQNQWVEIPTRHEYSCKDSKMNMLKKHTKLKEMYIVRYADDFKIFCRSYAAAEKVFHAVKQWLKERLRLDISEEKSKITNLEKQYTEFLGIKMKVRMKSGKYVTTSHMTDKAVQKVTRNLINQVQTMQTAKDRKDRYAQVLKYNSMVMGIHNYYSMAVLVSQDCAKIARQVDCVMKNRFGKELKSMKQIKRMKYRKRNRGKNYTGIKVIINKSITERYGPSEQLRFLDGFAVAPIGYAKMRVLMKKAQAINKYTPQGRCEIHRKLKMDLSVIRQLMETPDKGKTIQYIDNRISRYVAQGGKCYVTGKLLEIEEVYCHRKRVSTKADDSYANLIIVHKDIHKLIHTTKRVNIEKSLKKYGKYINLEKLNKLRRAVNNFEIKEIVLDNSNAK